MELAEKIARRVMARCDDAGSKGLLTRELRDEILLEEIKKEEFETAEDISSMKFDVAKSAQRIRANRANMRERRSA